MVCQEHSPEALLYLQDFRLGKFAIVVPTLLFYELGNALITKKAASHYVGKIMETLHNLHLEMIDIGFEAFRKVFQNAQEYGITFYDASYVTLMQKENCDFITADRKLYRKINKKSAGVKLLGASEN